MSRDLERRYIENPDSGSWIPTQPLGMSRNIVKVVPSEEVKEE
jgi:hypothetical protein